MRSTFAPVMVLVALAATACVESDVDDDVVDVDSATVDAVESPTGAVPSMGAGDITSSEDEPVDDPVAEVAAAIPARFHGEWNADRSACGTGNSETRLRISADRIRFYESTGVVNEVRVVSEGTIAVTATYQGEGDTWQDERRLTLAQDGRTIRVSGGGDLVRHRCP